MVWDGRKVTKGEIPGARESGNDCVCQHHYPCLRAYLITSQSSEQTWGDRIQSLWAASACTWTQSGGLHSGAAQYWLEEVRGRRVMQRTRHPWRSQNLSKGWESPDEDYMEHRLRCTGISVRVTELDLQIVSPVAWTPLQLFPLALLPNGLSILSSHPLLPSDLAHTTCDSWLVSVN